MIDTFDDLLNCVFGAGRSFEKLRDLSYGLLNCSGRATITGMITGAFKQFDDWSTYYRLFRRESLNMAQAFWRIFHLGVDQCLGSKYVVVHMDDTIIKKTGKNIPGTSWRRDPLGPPFHTNFIWGQRFIELALAIPAQLGIGPSRSIPIQFLHCPSAKKPKRNASEQELKHFKEEQKQKNLNTYGSTAVSNLRAHMNDHGMRDKQLVLCVDGSYTNAQILKKLPDQVSFIGRTRKDAKFNYPAENQSGVGRRKVYGNQLPTPEQIRQSDEYKWQNVDAWAAGKVHSFKIKVVEGFIWRKTGGDQKYRLIVISPLGYRKTKNAKVLYRRPAYLLCTDFDMSIQDTLQFYLWRWEVEVNIGEGKSLFGVGQAQIRNQRSSEQVPAFVTAIYSLLLLAQMKSNSHYQKKNLPRSKWYPKKHNSRITTGDLINKFKAQLYCRGSGISFSHFVNLQTHARSTRNRNMASTYSNFFARA